MKLTSTLAVLAATSIFANGATTIIDSTGLTPVNQANFNNGTAGALNTGAAWTFSTGTLGIDNRLASIGLEGRQLTPNTNLITLELWSNPANSSATLDLSNAALIATSTNTSAIGLNAVVDFLFSGVTLTDNTVYSVHVVGTGPGFGLVGTAESDLVPDSRLFQNGALIFGGTGTNGIDASFNVKMIPEPSSAALLGLAGSTLLLRRRK